MTWEVRYKIAKTIAVATLGCKVNQYESMVLAGMFQNKGYQVVEFSGQADVYLINTCSVTHLGDRKSRQLIRKAIRNNPDALVVVTGCYAQLAADEIMEIKGVDIVVGTQDRAKIVDLVEIAAHKKQDPINIVHDISREAKFEELSAPIVTGRVRAFLKIQEGCGNYCTYCIIPYARGPLRSRVLKSALEEAKALVGRGFKEIVVTGIHTGAYGRDLQEKESLASLLDSMVRIPGLARLRISSIESMDFTPELIEVISSNEKICRHLHIPLQSGSNVVLEKMGRRYTAEDFRRLVGSIRQKMPGIAVTTDIIAGFPGETEEQFIDTYRLTEEMPFSRLHVFKYSPRRGTPAADFPNQVPSSVKEERSARLLALGRKKALDFASGHLGCCVDVLVEGPSGQYAGFYEGLTGNYLKTIFPSVSDLRGEFVTVLVKKLQGEDLKGIII